MLPSSGCQRVDGRSHGSLIGDYYVEIDDGLGVQARDSGTADVHRDVCSTPARAESSWSRSLSNCRGH
jgi:hypothetical protein